MTAWILLLSFATSGATCQPVRIEDHEVCGDKGELGAHCIHLLSEKKRNLTFQEWEQERFGQLCMKFDAYANFKAALLKFCDQTKRCKFEEVEALEKMSVRLETLK